MSTVLERSRELARVRGENAEQRYVQLVNLLAGGSTDVQPETVLEVLAAADRSDDDLEADISRLEQRELARAEVKKLEAISAQITAVEQERSALKAEFEAVQRRTTERDQQLNAQLNLLQSQSAALAEFKRRLDVGHFEGRAEKARRTAACKVLADAGSKAANLRTEVQAAERRLAGVKEALATHEKGPSTDRPLDGYKPRQPDQAERDRLAGAVEGAQRHVDRLRRELEPLEQQIATANADLEALREEQSA